jgi:hypothetical protein
VVEEREFFFGAGVNTPLDSAESAGPAVGGSLWGILGFSEAESKAGSLEQLEL